MGPTFHPKELLIFATRLPYWTTPTAPSPVVIQASPRCLPTYLGSASKLPKVDVTHALADWAMGPSELTWAVNPMESFGVERWQC